MDHSRSKIVLYLAFVGILIANTAFWLHSRKVQLEWSNVPPAITADHATMFGLGDRQISYRLIGYFLQNLGNAGGRFEPLKEYNYAALENWFYTSKHLDQNSGYVPFLAAYYFGALNKEEDGNKELVAHVVNYLDQAGRSTYGQQWRWLAHAIYLTRFILKDRERALEMAEYLSTMEADVSPWGRQLASFINLETGNRRAAYEIMIRILKTEGDKLDPVEVIYIRDYICNRALTKEEAREHPLCKDLPAQP